MSTKIYTANFWKVIDGRNVNFVLSPADNEMFVVIGGTVKVRDQSGGIIRAIGTAVLDCSGQTGGMCEAVENAQILSNFQSGGYCQAFGHATISSRDQGGGYCRVYGGNAKFYSNKMYQGGVCEIVQPGRVTPVR